MTKLGACLLLSVAVSGCSCATTTLEYVPRDFVSAQARLDLAQKVAHDIILSEECREAIESSIGQPIPEKNVVPINLVNTIFWGNYSEGSVRLARWEDILDEVANAMCLPVDDGYVSYINLPIDTLFVFSDRYIQYLIAHETIHYFQCKSGYLYAHTPEEAHEEVDQLLEKYCRP